MAEKPLSLQVYDRPQFAERFGRTGGFAPNRKERMLEVTLDLLLTLAPRESLLLELGAGTGDFTKKIIASEHFSKIVVTDGASAMLELAQQRLSSRDCSLQFDLFDFTTQWADRYSGGRFDAVVSTLALHHALDKRLLFRQIFQVLRPRAVFVLGDHMAAATATGRRLLGRERALLRMGHPDDVDGSSIEELIEFDEKRQEAEGNNCESVAQYLDSLASSGFEEVECLWQDYWMAVFVAQKPA